VLFFDVCDKRTGLQYGRNMKLKLAYNNTTERALANDRTNGNNRFYCTMIKSITVYQVVYINMANMYSE